MPRRRPGDGPMGFSLRAPLFVAAKGRVPEWFRRRRWIHSRGRRGFACARRGLLAGAAVFLLVLGLWSLGAFRHLEWIALDLRYVSRFIGGVESPPAPVVVVAVDERALQMWGGWPWSRSLQAELIDAILAAEPAVLGIDILYTTPSASRAEDARLRTALQSDIPVVLAAAAGSDAELMPLADFVAGNVRLGHINSPADFDGAVRRLPMRVITSRGPVFGLSWEMALAMAEAAGAPPPAEPPLLADGTFMVNFRPRLDAPVLSIDAMTETVSIVDVASGAAVERLRGRPVLLGVTAAGLEGLDQHLTALRPLGQIPGVYVHAAALASILDGEYVRRQTTASVALTVLLVSLAFGAANFWLRPRPSTVLSLAGLCAAALVALWAFLARGLWIEAVPVLAAIALTYVGGLWHAHFYVDHEARHIRSTFKKYVAPEVVDALLSSPGAAELSGGRRRITVLFADIRGFTTFSEALPPERVVAVLNRYLALMADSVLIHGGMVDKFLGDGLMALFGAPLASERHAESAVRAGLHILMQVEALSASYHGAKLAVGVGIHTGEAVVGSVGSSARLEYTAIGDAVNVAARLQELAKPGTLVVSEAVMRELPPSLPIKVSPVAPVVLRGRSEPMVLYEITPDLAGTGNVVDVNDQNLEKPDGAP